jgi:ABC-type nickel/cobalt efflux system permease component RcnA
MENDLNILMATAATIAFVHTVFGPDHYLPFIVLSRARGWSIVKTIWITLLCGIGHVGSSIVLGAIGIGAGIGVSKLIGIESYRGNIAAWAFLAFGLVYTVWGIRRAIFNKPHKHYHTHTNGTVHVHDHTHQSSHDHLHGKNITPWILFIIFVLGPCEPLIPILMYPAAQRSTWGIIQVSLIFSTITILTMIVLVVLATYGLKMVTFGRLERYTHAIAGATICLSGLAILFLGL